MTEGHEIQCTLCNEVLLKSDKTLYVNDSSMFDGGMVDVKVMCTKCDHTVIFSVMALMQQEHAVT